MGSEMCIRDSPQLMTQRAKDMVIKVGGDLVGVVLNNINISQDSYYYYYSGYYYDYYYKSRETEDEPVEDKKDGKEEKLIAQVDAAGEDVNPKY